MSNAELVVSPLEIDFGRLSRTSMATRSVTLANTGDVAVAIDDVEVIGVGFSLVSTPAEAVLQPGAELALDVGAAYDGFDCAAGQAGPRRCLHR